MYFEVTIFFLTSLIIRSSIFVPLVFFAGLVFFTDREVSFDVEGLADLVRGFTLDHVGDRLATNFQKLFDIHVICSTDEIVEFHVVNLEKFDIPIADVFAARFLLVRILIGNSWVILVVNAPLDHFLQSLGAYLRQWNDSVFLFAQTFQQRPDGDALLGNFKVNWEIFPVGALEPDYVHLKLNVNVPASRFYYFYWYEG